ncbi:MAG: NAD(P)H-hydrate dehydratase [Thermoplasmatales archaeon]|nr:MAG: NAD(P)H-hydrate dehydratase [Thermoplasmatales archaeon]
MISGNEIKVVDKNSEYFGVPSSQLMENAGEGVAKFVINNLKPKNILLFCGTGNNGGDGFVAARYLVKKCKVGVFLTGKENEIKTKIAQDNFKKLKNIDIKIYTPDCLNKIDDILEKSDVIIDSMLGIGLTGDLGEPFHTIVNKINSQKNKKVISVDMPTGLETNLAIQPNYTLTFHDVKEGMNKNNSGNIHIVDINIPIEAVDYVGPGELSVYYPRPKKESHKGDNGSVLIIGGGPYVGAPTLSGMAALRTGADLAFIATPKNCWQSIASFSPNLIVTSLQFDFLTSTDIPIIEEILDRCDAVVIGPGLGAKKETKEAIIKIIELVIDQKKPLVIDADAINPIGEQLGVIENSTTIVTPHAGEFKELTGIDLSKDIDDRIRIVKEWAGKLGVTIFLKGYIDVLSDGKEVKLNKIHNEAMTVGGTGDVLAGVIGAMLSKGVIPFNAIRIAAFLNGEAGNESFNKKSYGLLATDIIEEIPSVLKRYL